MPNDQELPPKKEENAGVPPGPGALPGPPPEIPQPPGEVFSPQQYAGEDELPPHPAENQLQQPPVGPDSARQLGAVTVGGPELAGPQQIPAASVGNATATAGESFPMAVNVKADKVIPHIPGVNSSEGDTAYVDPQAGTTAQSPAEGHEAAQYGHGMRTRAANVRRDVVAEKAFKDELYEIVNDPRYIEKRFLAAIKSDFKRRGREPWIWGKRLPTDISDWGLQNLEALEDTHGVGSEENADLGWTSRYDALHSSTEVLAGKYDPTAPFREDDLARAREYDETAKHSEELAEHLRDHPVSEAYQAAHPDFGFGVQEMIALENLVEGYHQGHEPGRDNLLEAEKYAKPENLGFAPLVEDLQEAISHFAQNAQKGDETLLVEAKKSLTNPQTTLGNLVDLYRTVCERTNAIINARVAERKQVLEDVKSGKAADPNYQAPVVPNEHKAEILSEQGSHHLKEAQKWSQLADEREGSGRENALNIADIHVQKATDAEQAAQAVMPPANSQPEVAPGS